MDERREDAASEQEKVLCQLLRDRFFQRTEVLAVHSATDPTRAPHWHPEERPLRGRDLLRHLRGEQALGTYLLDRSYNCRFYTFDLDLEKTGHAYVGDVDALEAMMRRPVGSPVELDYVECNPREVWTDLNSPLRPWIAMTMRMLAEGIARRIRRTQNLPVGVVASGGKGMHIHVFCGERPAGIARAMANGALSSWVDDSKGHELFQQLSSFKWKHTLECYENILIEVFPKQDTIGNDGFGNLVRLPLGRHPTSGRPSYFVDLSSDVVRLPAAELDPLTGLKEGCCG